jgi:hypothetical protein
MSAKIKRLLAARQVIRLCGKVFELNEFDSKGHSLSPISKRAICERELNHKGPCGR